MEYFLNRDTGRVLKYDRKAQNPILRDQNFKFFPSSLGISPYIALGCLSVRTVFTEIEKLWQKNKKTGRSQIIENLLKREFYERSCLVVSWTSGTMLIRVNSKYSYRCRFSIQV